MSRVWDIAIGPSWMQKRPMYRVTIPAPLAQAFFDKGYDRATLTLTDEGVLLKPYKSEEGAYDGRNTVELVTLPWEDQ